MHPHRIAISSWPPSAKDLHQAVEWMGARDHVPSSFEFETGDWDALVDQGWLQVVTTPDSYGFHVPYLFGVPVQVYAQGFPSGVVWIRDQSGEIQVELALEWVTGDDPMSNNLPVHEYDLIEHPQKFVKKARGHLLAGGFTVFTYTLAEIVAMIKNDGYHGVLQRAGYDIKTCEPVWFKTTGRSKGVHLMLGALKLPGR